MNLYKRVELKEGEYVQFLGVHALDWRWEWGEPTNAFVEADLTELKEKLEEIRDLARTGLKPDVYPTEEDWLRHKCNRIAGDLDRIINEL